MRIEAVIFDLDGTLVHTIEDIAGAANEMFSRNELPTHDVAYYLKWIGNGAVRFIENALGSDVGRDQLMGYVAQFKEIYGQNLHEKSRIFDGIPYVLDRLVESGIRLSVLSNKPHPLTRKVCDFYLSGWPFDPVLGQREEVPRKPDPAAALEIAGSLQIEPGKILFVGDSNNDILTARHAGMIPLGVTWGYGRPGKETGLKDQKLINHPAELLPIVL